MGWVIAVIAVLLVGCGSSGSPVATSSRESPRAATTTPVEDELGVFADSLRPVVRDISADMMWMGGAAESLDMADLRAACRNFDSTIDQLAALLPSPDVAVTDHLEDAVTHWRDMAHICQGASMRMDRSEIREMTDLRDAGEAELERAIEMMTGPS